ncbi:NrdH-redoxin [Halobacteriovorax marinus]|uniref:NrdH-redoxin n=1 Tax=Halobacteriovorax marinus TaxID=97084 RepID=A0A1Y5FBJ0_9BACT|nr:NrdH-redoxin [Halobacteriovorax marinus]
MKIIRKILGIIILLLDKLTSPRPEKISDVQRQRIIEKTQNLELFEFNACPFCVKVRRHMKKHNISIPLRDAKNDQQFREELANGGGKIKVPCLKISVNGEERWLYESDEIINYFEQNVLLG